MDTAAGDSAVEKIKKLAKATFTDGVLSEIGSFGGFFEPKLTGMTEPVLISSADGVGTKLKLAFMTGRHVTVGQDLVNHCINDILVHGARAIFFLDYIATGKLSPDIIAEVVKGLSVACQDAGVALLGGETAEMPDFYQAGEYDLAGFIVGLVDKGKVINGSSIEEGDVCIGLRSDGLHTNGYTLARKVAFDIAGLKPGDKVEGLDGTIDEVLMQVHRCYANPIHSLLAEHPVRGMAHITGGGLQGNLNRIIPDGLAARIRLDSWSRPAVFEFLQREGNIDEAEMFHAFNMGIGYVLVVEPDLADAVAGELTSLGETAYRIGEIVDAHQDTNDGNEKVTLV
ncbi:phosphoribosylformylglycinamidine cyclo-ligase [candidate division GN15 bacterium]|nr:phosphoribosylformylglycinamidine cyclo-ligase [candidate division GN15 bacterium]